MTTIDPLQGVDLVPSMKENCYCISLDRTALDDALAAERGKEDPAYVSEVHLLGARLYQGQIANFGSVGGGFAAVFTESAATCRMPESSC